MDDADGANASERRRTLAAEVLMSRCIYISDVHMGDERSLKPPIGQPYGWLSATEAASLGRFLRSPEALAADELYVVGDFLDLWITPIDVAPPTPAEIFASAPNRPIMDGLKAWRDAGKTLHFVRGNHDLQVTAQDVEPLGFRFHGAPVAIGPYRISHGHERCLFNGPDPTNRPLPFGYYISRFVATAANRSKEPASFSMRLILRNPDDVLDLATGGKTLGEAVFDVVVDAARLRLDEPIVERDGAELRVGEIRPMFAKLYEEWGAAGRGSAATAVTCEWDPWYGLAAKPGTISIIGHSHDRVFSYGHEARTVYVNTGAWDDRVAHYATTWTDDRSAYAALYRWNGTRGVYINKAGVAI